MAVKELIELLGKLNQDAEVYVENSTTGCLFPTTVVRESLLEYGDKVICVAHQP